MVTPVCLSRGCDLLDQCSMSCSMLEAIPGYFLDLISAKASCKQVREKAHTQDKLHSDAGSNGFSEEGVCCASCKPRIS